VTPSNVLDPNAMINSQLMFTQALINSSLEQNFKALVPKIRSRKAQRNAVTLVDILSQVEVRKLRTAFQAIQSRSVLGLTSEKAFHDRLELVEQEKTVLESELEQHMLHGESLDDEINANQ
jgi:hypothetical protein